MYMMLQQHINCKEHQESQHNTLTSPLKIFLLWFQYIPSYNNKHYNNRKNKKTTERWQKTDHLRECTTEIISKFGTKSPIHLFYTRNHSWLSVKCKNAGHLHYFKQQSDRSLKGTPSKDASKLENRKYFHLQTLSSWSAFLQHKYPFVLHVNSFPLHQWWAEKWLVHDVPATFAKHAHFADNADTDCQTQNGSILTTFKHWSFK